MHLPKIKFFNYSVNCALNLTSYVNQVKYWLDYSSSSHYLVCLNPHSFIVSLKDQVFNKSIYSADIIIPDGIGIVIASRFLNLKIFKRITGPDLFFALCKTLDLSNKYSFFFLGSTQKTLKKIKFFMKQNYPNIKIVGMHSPPFKENFNDYENKKIIKKINLAKPDILWIGMTAPKQEKWIFINKNRLNVKFIGAVGSVFDFCAGNVNRPNIFFQRFGFEWLSRFLKDPLRLWKRNLVSMPYFIALVIMAKFSDNE